jgi:antagonist of KipI
MTTVRVLKAGMLTSIQDLGRTGLQCLGIPPSGAMDAFALCVANLLVGNPPGEACLEMTLLGPTLEFEGAARVAVTGGDLGAELNGRSIEMWCSFPVGKGDRLTWGKALSGCRAYAGFAGGIDVPLVLGSKSTFRRGGFGGLEGRNLQAGDGIELGRPSGLPPARRLPSVYRPRYTGDPVLRVLPGPQIDYFDDDAVSLFFSAGFVVTPDSDRMGYRLAGPNLSASKSAEIISDAVVAGSVQIPGGGAPIVMMADRQTIGGYPKIATVITPDIDLVGQLKPGDKLRFRRLSLAQAHQIYATHIRRIQRIRENLKGLGGTNKHH